MMGAGCHSCIRDDFTQWSHNIEAVETGPLRKGPHLSYNWMLARGDSLCDMLHDTPAGGFRLCSSSLQPLQVWVQQVCIFAQQG